MNFNIFWRFQKNEYFWGYGDFCGYFGGSLDYFWGAFQKSTVTVLEADPESFVRGGVQSLDVFHFFLLNHHILQKGGGPNQYSKPVTIGPPGKRNLFGVSLGADDGRDPLWIRK